MSTDARALRAAVAGYARQLHAAAGTGHHVASPLGAWLLLALCGPLIPNAAPGASAARDALGCDPDQAARLAAGLLARPHPQVAAAAAAWSRPDTLSEPARAWLAGLPDAAATGPVPGQAAADAWTRDHSFNLIERFPGRISPAASLVLASVLATRVSWQQPFDLAPAGQLGPGSAWPGRLGQVLRTPAGPGTSGHRQLIAATPEAGDVIVHLGQARDGLLVASVAGAPAVAPASVLAAAYRIAADAAAGVAIPARPLAGLPLGEAPLWRIREEPAGPGGSADECRAVLPAWSARTELDLAAAGLGFARVGAGLGGGPWTAAQSATARYSRTGFEAAAATAVMIAASTRLPGAGRRRVAELRFGHPYAVVAAAVDGAGTGPPGPWHGVPVFSAWVASPEDAAL